METEILSLDKCSTRKIGLGSLTSATKLSWFNQTLFSVCILLVTTSRPNVVKGEEIENLQNNIRRRVWDTKVSQNQISGLGIDLRQFQNNEELKQEKCCHPFYFRDPEYKRITLKQIWSDAGSGARDNVSIWRPSYDDSYPDVSFEEGTFYSLGDIAVKGYEAPDTFFMMRASSQAVDTVFEPASEYIPTWDDRGSGAYQDCRLWTPNCPDNYHYFGQVATNGPDPPEYSSTCVNNKYITESFTLRGSIWSDARSGANEDVTLMPAVIGRGVGVTSGLFRACMDKDEKCKMGCSQLDW